ncbi:hypothetical protein FB45DRAFT_1035373 [Roridomyces roridus]|uniref:Uncharacterized protein n=1 Tax=Roridomyces roridus TaxID=1738132 RepID=A0AAD7BAQ7_9AGAR|nr:hypothetical protein FB45DRAFT_1035373 [Roridomyces roridus]
MSPDCSPSVSLPPELERLIFETAALRYPGRIPTLLLLAKRVHEWIEPLLYQVIPIIIYDDRSKAYRRMSGSRMLERLQAGDRPLQFFSSAVRDVEIINLELFRGSSEKVWADDDLKRVLSACGPNIRSLLIIGDLESKPILSSLADCRPTRAFVISGLEEPMPDFKRLFFRNVTHLVIGELNRVLRLPSDPPPNEGYELERESQWSKILKLPALTHLAVIHPLLPSAGQRILAGAPHIRAFVIVLLEDNEPSPARIRARQEIQAFPWDDDRVVALPAASDLTRGREGFSTKAWTPQVDELWAQVDEFIEDKRRGKIPASEYRLLLDSSFSRSLFIFFHRWYTSTHED